MGATGSELKFRMADAYPPPLLLADLPPHGWPKPLLWHINLCFSCRPLPQGLGRRATL